MGKCIGVVSGDNAQRGAGSAGGVVYGSVGLRRCAWFRSRQGASVRGFGNPQPCAHALAFTLVELLAAVVIILILVALVFVGMRKGVGQAQQIKCLNNLKQVSLALRSYASDHDGFLPNHAGNPEGHWPNVLTRQGYTPDGQKDDYYQPLGIYVCPSQPNKELRWGVSGDGVGRVAGSFFTVNSGSYWFSSHYGVNSFLMNVYDGSDQNPPFYFPKFKLSAIRHPARVYFISDAADWSGGLIPYIGVSYPNMILRHNNNTVCNMIFVDGHAEALTEKNTRRNNNVHFNDGDDDHDPDNK